MQNALKYVDIDIICVIDQIYIKLFNRNSKKVKKQLTSLQFYPRFSLWKAGRELNLVVGRASKNVFQ
jgi:hypothetical protein